MKQPSEEIRIAAGDLLVFVDDTGHESFGSQRYFGLGGCAVLAEHYDRLKNLGGWMCAPALRATPVARLHCVG